MVQGAAAAKNTAKRTVTDSKPMWVSPETVLEYVREAKKNGRAVY